MAEVAHLFLAPLLFLVAFSSTEDCGIYLAPSTIEGAGLGVFAGKDFRKGDVVILGDIFVPLIEMSANNIGEYHNLWKEYAWSSGMFPYTAQEGKASFVTQLASPGVGALPNSHAGLANIVCDGRYEKTKMDSMGLHRSRDPGVGAFTPYHNRLTWATRDIAAGEELVSIRDRPTGHRSFRSATS